MSAPLAYRADGSPNHDVTREGIARADAILARFTGAAR